METGQAATLRDLLFVYDMQIKSMQEAEQAKHFITASLHERMARQLLDTYFQFLEKVLDN